MEISWNFVSPEMLEPYIGNEFWINLFTNIDYLPQINENL